MTESTPETHEAEEIDAHAAHGADRPPTPEEERDAEGTTLDPSVGEHYRDAAGKGANIKGEGAIE